MEQPQLPKMHIQLLLGYRTSENVRNVRVSLVEIRIGFKKTGLGRIAMIK